MPLLGERVISTKYMLFSELLFLLPQLPPSFTAAFSLLSLFSHKKDKFACLHLDCLLK